MPRQIIVGDVHGCLPELRELIDKLQRFFDHAIGVDLGCVYGHFLGAIIFDSERPGHRSVVVKSKSLSVCAAENLCDGE